MDKIALAMIISCRTTYPRVPDPIFVLLFTAPHYELSISPHVQCNDKYTPGKGNKNEHQYLTKNR